MTFRAILALAIAGSVAACGGSATGGNEVAPQVQNVAPPAGKQWTEVVEKTAEGFRMGNPNAPVKLVEYGARLCPACKAFAAQGYEPLTTQYVSTGKVSYEFRDFLIHGPAELALAVLGQCGGPGPFFPLLDQMYINQESFITRLQAMPPAEQQALQGQPPAQVLATLANATGAVDFVKQRGVSDTAARACLADQKRIEAIAKVTEDASANGSVTQTPTLIVNGNKLASGSWPDVEAALKNAGAR